MARENRFFIALALVMLVGGGWIASTSEVISRPPVARLTVSPLEAPRYVKQASLARGGTLGDLLQDLGIARSEQPDWLAATRPHLDPRSLPVGLLGEAIVDEFGNVRTVRLSPDWRFTVIVERTSSVPVARREDRPVERQLVVVTGVVQSSLFEAVTKLGETEDLALSLADLFQWDIDFHREVQKGDTFALVVERIRSNGKIVAYGPVVSARYTNRGVGFTAVRWATQNGPLSYYDDRGRPLRKQFLRAPLRFSRLTSRFSASRLHPILGRRLPHWGVDYAAPVGTPVMATADGVVSFMGVKSGAGNTVDIRHSSGFTTSYLHLSRAASGVRAGVRVGQGQVIGFVGSTGLSTGPHLDYRVTANGKPLNPLRIGQDPAPPLHAWELKPFSSWALVALNFLQRPGLMSSDDIAMLRKAVPAHLGV